MPSKRLFHHRGCGNLRLPVRRGAALLLTVVVLFVAVLLALVILRAATAAIVSASRAKARMVAFEAAEAGVQYSLWRLNTDENFQGVEDFDELPISGVHFTVTVNVDPGDPERTIVVSEGRVSRGYVRLREVLGRTAAGGGGGSLHLGEYAILAEGDVLVNDQSRTAGANANVHSNSDLTVRDQSSINGRASASGTVTVVGQSNINDPEYPDGYSGAPEVDLPDREQIDAMAAAWRAAALEGGTVGPVSTGSLTGPAYVDGNIRVRGGSLRILGAGPIYVRGDFTIEDQSTVTTEALVVVEGRFILGDQCSYRAVNRNVGLVSLAEHNAAIELRDQVSARDVGVFWAANGGIYMWDQSGSISGALVSTGDPALYGIRFGDQNTITLPGDIDFEVPDVGAGGGAFRRVSWQQLRG